MEQPMNQNPPVAVHATSYAGFWKRFFAYIIDAILLSIVSVIMIVPLIGVIGITALTQSEEDMAPGLIALFFGAYFTAICVIAIAGWLYYALMESKKGATFGKMALGICVTDMDGGMISFGRATGRYFAKFLSSLTFGIGYIIAGFTQQKQALHDIIAKTLVVNK